MFQKEDLDIICCPICKADLIMENDETLECTACDEKYQIKNGIPRLLYLGERNASYNSMWDYKWFHLDNGNAYAYRSINPDDPAYELHNCIRHNEYNGEAFKHLKDGVAIDIGCGIGQHSAVLLKKGAKRVYAVDLTRGVDVGKKIFEERYPELVDKIVFLQANGRFLPIKTESVDLGMALASIHHSGYLEECVKEIIRATKINHRFFIWVYPKPILPIGDKERNFLGLFKLGTIMFRIFYVELLHNIFKRLPNKAVVSILRFFASDFIYFFVKQDLPLIGRNLFKVLPIPGINNIPDKGYRLINLYDAYSPTYAEHLDEYEVIEWGKKHKFNIIGFSDWRIGWLGEKFDKTS